MTMGDGLVWTALWGLVGALFACGLVWTIGYLTDHPVPDPLMFLSSWFGAHLFIGHGGK